MIVAKEFQAHLANIYSKNDREDFLFLEENWKLYSDTYSRILTKGSIILETSGKKQNLKKHFVHFLQIGEIIAYDLLCSKQLLDKGFLTQSAAISRPSMETGLILSILISLNRLSEWLDGEKINVPIHHGKKSKEIGQCTYGNLIDAFDLLINGERDVFINERFSEIHELPVDDLFNGILDIHRGYRTAINTNKYIHKGQEVLNFQRRLFRNYSMISQSTIEDDKQLFHTILLDLHFELYSTLLKCLMGQTSSRYTELIQLTKDFNVDLYGVLRNDIIEIGSLCIQNYNSYKVNLEQHMVNWQSRQDKLELLSKT